MDEDGAIQWGHQPIVTPSQALSPLTMLALTTTSRIPIQDTRLRTASIFTLLTYLNDEYARIDLIEALIAGGATEVSRDWLEDWVRIARQDRG
jgi:hypothetical protein